MDSFTVNGTLTTNGGDPSGFEFTESKYDQVLSKAGVSVENVSNIRNQELKSIAEYMKKMQMSSPDELNSLIGLTKHAIESERQLFSEIENHKLQIANERMSNLITRHSNVENEVNGVGFSLKLTDLSEGALKQIEESIKTNHSSSEEIDPIVENELIDKVTQDLQESEAKIVQLEAQFEEISELPPDIEEAQKIIQEQRALLEQLRNTLVAKHVDS